MKFSQLFAGFSESLRAPAYFQDQKVNRNKQTEHIFKISIHVYVCALHFSTFARVSERNHNKMYLPYVKWNEEKHIIITYTFRFYSFADAKSNIANYV